jgi:hypothetical protein
VNRKFNFDTRAVKLGKGSVALTHRASHRTQIRRRKRMVTPGDYKEKLRPETPSALKTSLNHDASPK